MVEYLNPIQRQNLIDRFRDWVTFYANSGIVWGTNAPPNNFIDWNATGRLGGDTNGPSDEVNASQIPTNPSTASEVVSSLEAGAAKVTNVRRVRSRIVRDGDGALLFDETNLTHLNTGYRTGLSIIRNRPAAGVIKAIGTNEDYFSSLRQSFEQARDNVVTFEDTVCHASCHGSCHGSRGRR